jgi:Calcium binding
VIPCQNFPRGQTSGKPGERLPSWSSCSRCGWRIVISLSHRACNIVTSCRQVSVGLHWWSLILKAFATDSIFGRDSMKKPKKDPVREDRIHNEAIVDANGPEEQVMGWYYYLDDKIRFPFQAKCIAPKVVSPLRKGETVEVQRMAPEDACSADMLVLIRWHERTMAVPLSQLVAIDPDQSSAEAIGDWHYWVAQGYCF